MEWIKKNKNILYPEILSATGLLYIILKMRWHFLDKSLKFVSGATHLLIITNQRANLETLDIRTFLLVQEMYPNLYHNLAAVISYVTGSIETAAELVNLLMIVATMFGAYMLGKVLWNEDAGLMAALIVPAFPRLEAISVVENIDVATGAFTVWALWALIRSERFENRRYTIAFFALCGLGMLTKWAFAFFLIVPFVVVFCPVIWKMYKKKESRMKAFGLLAGVIGIYPLMMGMVRLLGLDDRSYPPFDSFFVLYIGITVMLLAGFFVALKMTPEPVQMQNLVPGFILFFVIVNHYYLFNIFNLIETYVGRFWIGKAKHAITLTPYNFWVEYFSREFMGLPLLIITIAGLVVYAVWKKQWTFERTLAITSIISGLLLLELQPTYFSRYFIPLAGIIAPLAVFWIFKLPRPHARWFFIVPLMTLSIVTWAGWTFLPEQVKYSTPWTPVNHPQERGWNVAGISRGVYKTWKSDLPGSGDGMFVFYNDLKPGRVKPLAFSYYLKQNAGPKEEVFLLTHSLSLSGEKRVLPLIYYIQKKPDPLDNYGDAPEEDLESEIDMTMEQAHPEAIYFCRFRKKTSGRGIPLDVLHALSPMIRRERDYTERFILRRSIPVADDGVVDIYSVRLR